MWTHISTLGRDIYKYITFLNRGWFDLFSIKSKPLEISWKPVSCRNYAIAETSIIVLPPIGRNTPSSVNFDRVARMHYLNRGTATREILLLSLFLDQNSGFSYLSPSPSSSRHRLARVSPYYITTHNSQRDLSKNRDHKQQVLIDHDWYAYILVRCLSPTDLNHSSYCFSNFSIDFL